MIACLQRLNTLASWSLSGQAPVGVDTGKLMNKDVNPAMESLSSKEFAVRNKCAEKTGRSIDRSLMQFWQSATILPEHPDLANIVTQKPLKFHVTGIKLLLFLFDPKEKKPPNTSQSRSAPLRALNYSQQEKKKLVHDV